MKKIRLFMMIGFLTILSFAVRAQQNLPYYSGFDTPAEQAGWQLHKLGVTGTFGTWTIGGGGFSAPNCLSHDYNTTGTVEDWYVSPALNFMVPSKIALKIKVFEIMGAPISTDYLGIWYSSGSQDPALGQYTEVANFTNIPSGSVWRDTIILLPFTAGTGYIGFKFKNDNNWFTTAIDNINVTIATSGIDDTEYQNNVSVFPNPSHGKFLVESKKNISSVEVYNLLGELVYATSNASGQKETQIDLSDAPKGVYMMKFSDGTESGCRKIVLN